MQFYKREYGKEWSFDGKKYPCVILTTDSWDDLFEYETLFHASYFEKENEGIGIGALKIMTTKGNITRLQMDSEFEGLDESFCSVGQDTKYYKELRDSMTKQQQNDILYALRDAAVNEKIAEQFEKTNIFRKSLLRFSDAEKAYREAISILNSKEIDSIKQFTFNCQVGNAESLHTVYLDFEANKHKVQIPYRINAFIGKNATGKTKVLTELASQISGVTNSKEGNFFPERPSFSKIIALSYSAFDELYKPFEKKNKTEDEINKIGSPEGSIEKSEGRKDTNILFSYVYCGLRTNDGIMTIEDLEINFMKAYLRLKRKKRLRAWNRIIKNIVSEEQLTKIDELVWYFEYDKSDYNNEDRLISFLSSGQNILLSTITEVIANIEVDSLILFDEPELHLHPNAVANFMKMYYEILEEFESYSIICTHSPLIIQEIPSRFVKVFNRVGNSPSIDPLYNECFGENISNITNDVFDVREHESNYKSWLRKEAEKNSKEEIISAFEEEPSGGLSFNALTFLNALYYNKAREEQ